jgi:hypothetical protein
MAPNIHRFRPSRAALAEALAASWDARTAYLGVHVPGNPALGQCYPTARVVQWFYPAFEVAVGEVAAGDRVERHFWNIRGSGADAEWLDFSWMQFPPGARVTRFEMLDLQAVQDSPATQARCALLMERVLAHLGCDDPRLDWR